MNILFVSAIFPFPLYSGGQIRIYNLLKRLSKNNSIYLYTFIRSEEEKKYSVELSFCKAVVCVNRGRAWQPKYISKALFGKLPFLMSTYDNVLMRKEIGKAIEKSNFDLIHIEPGYIWPSIPETTLPLIVAEHNIEHTVYQGFVDGLSIPGVKHYMQYDVNKLIKWEKIVWEKANQIIAVSNEDKSIISSVIDKPIHVVSNGVDESLFRFNPKVKVLESFQCLFVGNFRWVQNKDAVSYLLKTLWPNISAAFPKAQLRIVGREFPRSLRSKLSSSVKVIDTVDDITSEFNMADMLLAPLRIGGGTKYKILEAMASGVPVLTTKKGGEGMPLIHEKNCFLCTTTNDWTRNIEELLRNNELRNSIIHNARNLIEKEYTWKKIAEELDTIWQRTYEK